MRTHVRSMLRRRAWLPLVAGSLLLLAFAAPALATGPPIDWDPAYGWQPGASPQDMPLGGEFQMVGLVSKFDNPFQFLDASDPTKEYTFYIHGLISQGTSSLGLPTQTVYTTHYSGGTFDLYEGSPRNSSFTPNPPNADVPSTFTDGTLLLHGDFTSFEIITNDFSIYQAGDIEGTLNWTGGTLLSETFGALGVACPGLFMGGASWIAELVPQGYLVRHVGKIDINCPVPARKSTWGQLKQLYR